MFRPWQNLPPTIRSVLRLVVKVVLTVGVFVVLLTHQIDDGKQGSISIWQAITAHVRELNMQRFVPFVALAIAIKGFGIVSSMFRWHLLLMGQGIRFNFGHIVGSFLIGRFLGTFLPSTLGLDGYKLYDAARFSGRVVEPAAATAVEKAFGFSGVFLTFLVALPFGIAVLGEAASVVATVTVPIALGVILALFLVLFRPGIIQACIQIVPSFGKQKLERFVDKTSHAAAAYRGKAKLLGIAFGLSFLVHFCTAAMYFFTALAIGVAGADFWYVTFASSIQIFATVISPFTVGGEGVREMVQAILLTKHMGAGESVLSAALGFWAAEALTLFGAVFLWIRPANYRPRVMELEKNAEEV